MAETSDRYTERSRTLGHLAQLRGIGGIEAPGRMRVLVAPEAANLRAGQLATVALVNLAARLTDRIDIHADSAPAAPGVAVLLGSRSFGGSELVSMANRIWRGEFTSGGNGPADVTVGIGSVGEPVDLGVGIDEDFAPLVLRNRTAALSANRPMSGLVAGALGATQAAKLLYRGLGGRVDERVRLDLGPLGSPIDRFPFRIPGRPMIIGVGAIGCAVLFALIGVEATGELVLVDPDGVRDRDLMRYVLFDEQHIGIAKVNAAKRMTEGTGLAIEGHELVFRAYLAEDARRRDQAELVLSLVDSYDQRYKVAGELPHQVLNAATADRDFTITFNSVDDGYACLRCLYPDRQAEVDADAVMARWLRLDVDVVHGLRLSKAPMTGARARAVALAHGKAADAYEEFGDDPIDSFYRRTCGTAPVAFDRHGETYAPIAFLPALAGFLTASALVAGTPPARYFRMDAFDGLLTPRRASPLPRPGCDICGNPLVVGAYHKRWRRPALDRSA